MSFLSIDPDVTLYVIPYPLFAFKGMNSNKEQSLLLKQDQDYFDFQTMKDLFA